MTFTITHARKLAEARAIVEKLEAEERAAVNACADVLLGAGLKLADGLAPVTANWAAVVLAHAGAIRDALEPFDSGARPTPAVYEVPNAMLR